jgi:hypothetical protein
MSRTTQATQRVIQIDVETLRRVVQEAVREEVTRFFETPPSEWLEHWLHEDTNGQEKVQRDFNMGSSNGYSASDLSHRRIIIT